MRSHFGTLMFAAVIVLGSNTAHADTPATPIHIDVMPTANPDQIPLRVGNLGSAILLGLAFGPGATSGELAGSANASGRATTLSERVAPFNLRMGEEFASAMATALQQRGVDAAVQGSAARAPTMRLTFSFEEIAYERRVWGKIGPKMVVRIRVRDAASDDRLFGDTYMYDMYAQTIGYTILRPPEEVGFEDSDQVLAHPDRVVEGFRIGFRMIAEEAAKDIVEELQE